jgi:hypothetical protein
MAKELEALRSQRHYDASAAPTESPEFPESSQDSPDHPLELSGTAILDDSELDDEPFELEDVVIDKDTVVEIFTLYAFPAFFLDYSHTNSESSFCLHFYPHLPILNPSISISGLYETSPILFWTIVAITTRRPVLPSHEPIAESLQEPFLRFFRTEILDAPLPLQTIQAITYLTMWPFPLRFQTNDPSWLYSGVAVNAATYMGLHRPKQAPSLRSIGVYAGSPRGRAHTWLGLFLSNTAYIFLSRYDDLC